MRLPILKIIGHFIRLLSASLTSHSANSELDDYRKISKIGFDSQNVWIQRSASIGGWLFQDEHEYLWELAMKDSESADILEIGTWQGKSACIFAGSCIEKFPTNKVFCVDPFDMSGTESQIKYHKNLTFGSRGTFYQFIENSVRFGFSTHVVPLAAKSGIALKNLSLKLRLIFIDGAHDYESVSKDVQVSTPHLIKGGLLVFHDTYSENWPDITKYIEEVMDQSSEYKFFGKKNTIKVYEKL